MSAWCPHERFGYNVSLADLHDASREALVWAAGFVAGNEPDPPVDDDGIEVEEDTDLFEQWDGYRPTYLASGEWPRDVPSARTSAS